MRGVLKFDTAWPPSVVGSITTIIGSGQRGIKPLSPEVLQRVTLRRLVFSYLFLSLSICSYP